MNRRPIVSLILAGIVLLPLAACHGKPSPPAAGETTAPIVIVSGARLVLPAVPGNPAALYLTIANPAEAPLRLTGLTVAGAAATELHETRGGAMTPLAGLDIAPGTAASLEPGSRHAMVMGLAPAPKAGSAVAIILRFANGRAFPTTARVETVGGPDTTDAMPGDGPGDGPGARPADTMSSMDMGHGH
jgi:copper(I)-binding protein